MISWHFGGILAFGYDLSSHVGCPRLHESAICPTRTFSPSLACRCRSFKSYLNGNSKMPKRPRTFSDRPRLGQ